MILWFENISASDTGAVGGKAANLGECARAGLPVPRGFVVSTEAYRQATSSVAADTARLAARGETNAARSLILGAELPASVSDEITTAYRQLGEPPVAVRSSATAEDLADASFAGQQDTYLNIRGVTDLLDAIHNCWASLWSDRAVEYRRRQGVQSDGLALAVVVQEMVAPDVAGVLFTHHPVTGDQDKMLVSASYGLGESVVSALVTPDTFEIARATRAVTLREIGTKETRIDAVSSGDSVGAPTEIDSRSATDRGTMSGSRITLGDTVTSDVPLEDRECSSLTDTQLLQLLDLGERVEKHYGTGQDIEWACVGQKLYLLQARPITTEAADVPGHEPMRGRFGTFVRGDLIEHFPAPFPLDVVAVRSVLDGALRAFGVRGVRAATLIQGDDDGVIRLTLAKFTPAGSFARNLPRTMRRAFRHDPLAWPEEERELRRRLDVMTEATGDLSSAEDAAVLQLLLDVVEQIGTITHDRFLYYLTPMMTRRNNAIALITLARLSETVTTEDLYAGIPYKTAEITAALRSLVDRAQKIGVVDAIISAPQGGIVAALESLPEGCEFLVAANKFLTDFGARTARLYLPFSNRSWREDPETFYALLAASLRGGSLDRESGDDPASRVEQRLPRPLRRFWKTNTEQIRAMHLGREGTVYLMEEFLCVARVASDEIARRLVARGQLALEDDLRFLYVEEIAEALGGLAGAEDFVDVDRSINSPDTTGAHGTVDVGAVSDRGNRIGSTRGWLQRKVVRRRRYRALAESVWWDRGESVSPDASKRSEKTTWDLTSAATSFQLTGLSASAGVGRGPARIVRSPSDFHLLCPGDVLVCPYTDPTWTPLFSLAAAIVAETGGPLSHAAIVAREYGIPAVLGVDGATHLPTGAELIVDGGKGTVSMYAPRNRS